MLALRCLASASVCLASSVCLPFSACFASAAACFANHIPSRFCYTVHHFSVIEVTDLIFICKLGDELIRGAPQWAPFRSWRLERVSPCVCRLRRKAQRVPRPPRPDSLGFRRYQQSAMLLGRWRQEVVDFMEE